MRRLLILLALLASPAFATIQYIPGGAGQLIMFGLSSDTKPSIANGHIFVETDTAKIFVRTAGSWVEQLNSAYALAGASSVDTANSPNAGEFAKFTDADTIEGRTAAETKADLDLEIGTDLAPSNLDYLVGTASGNLSAEIAVGTTPGGELGNTWASPTLDDGVAVSNWNLTTPSITTDITIPNTGLHLLDTNASHDLIIAPGSNISADRTLTVTTGDSDRTLTLSGNADITGTNTGDQTSVSGNAGTVTFADAGGDTTTFVALGTAATGSLAPATDSNLSYNATTDVLTATAALGSGSTGSTAAANDNDTSVATTAFVQQEIDDGDNLTDNCALENDSTPIPDSCVGDGSDAGGSYSFNSDGDNNSPQTISSGDELLIAGGTNGIDTVSGATDTVTINLDLSESSAGGELGGTLDAPTIDDSVSVVGWTIDELNLDAGGSGAGTWPTLTSGTLLTTAEDGAIEEDADVFYLTTDAGNRGYVPARYLIRADSARTLPNDTNRNAIFNSPANGRFTLETGTYKFEALIGITAMSGTTGSATMDWLGAGTATAGTWLWTAHGADATMPGEQAARNTMRTSATSATSMWANATATAMSMMVEGTFEITVAGTFIPSITLTTAAAASVNAGSYFMLERIGSTSLTSIGQVD